MTKTEMVKWKQAWYLANRERILKSRKQYYQANRKVIDARNHQWAINNPEKKRAHVRKYARAHLAERWQRQQNYLLDPLNQLKQKTRLIVSGAVKSGKLKRPNNCSMCNRMARIEAHHHRGYSKEFALDVVWVCHQCHVKLDRQPHQYSDSP